MQDAFNTLSFLNREENSQYYSLPKLEQALNKPLSRLPISIRILLESLLRNCDGKSVKKEDVELLAAWNATNPSKKDIPFIVSRVILQDFTGVPLLADLAAMRDAVKLQNLDPTAIEPIVPVDLVIDHSVQVDKSAVKEAFDFNLAKEFERNEERYSFLSWGQNAFKTFQVIPPGVGIVHQVNLEYLSSIITKKDTPEGSLLHFDTVLGTDSHTTMIGALGILGWGVGGIEAEASMLGLPYSLQTPEVIGVNLYGKLQPGITATDLTLKITELLREAKVVGKFIEFFGEGASSLSLADRATIANMAPEYGATIGFFPVDEKTLDYFRLTGRKEEDITRVKNYLKEQNLFGISKKGDIDFTGVIELDLNSVRPCISGPKRPQDRINLSDVKASFEKTLTLPVSEGGYGKELSKKVCVHSDGNFHMQEPHITGGKQSLENPATTPPSVGESEMVSNRPFTASQIEPGYTHHKSCDMILDHGSIVIAAITSCTNTSNPSVMIAAGLLAKKAVEKGLTVDTKIKTSLAPGSRVVTDYLKKAGLQPFLDKLGFQLVAYGCTTCIGNSGPLDEEIERAIKANDLITASVLSGNRNFEARIHGSVKANFLMSPPLVVAFALTGRIGINFKIDPIGYTTEKEPVFLKDIWPSDAEIEKTLQKCLSPETFKERYRDLSADNPLWDQIETKETPTYPWHPLSTYIRKPPFFKEFSVDLPERPLLENMRPLALFGDSITTDHISPAGAFRGNTPAGAHLISVGIEEKNFNSYGSRRGNHDVMIRGTFANVRLRNQMADSEGGFTKVMPEGKEESIFKASQIYAERKVPLIVFAGKDYGMGSSRDWAAKGTSLLGVKAVVVESFERIHRSNLVGMGVLPLQFSGKDNLKSLQLTGEEEFSITGLGATISPRQTVTLEIKLKGEVRTIPLICRLDTDIDVEYYRHGGILPYVLRKTLANSNN
jgi:aconitate hydratase